MREMFETTIDRLLADLVDTALITRAEDGAWPQALWAAVEETGLTFATVPEDLGGAGATWADAYGLVRAAGREAAPIPLAESIFANWLMSQAGLEAMAGPLTIAVGDSLSVRSGAASGKLSGVPWGRAASHVVTVAGVAEPTVVVLACADATATAGLNIAREPRDDLAFVNAAVVASAPLPAHLPADTLLLGGAMIRTGQMAGGLERLLAMSVEYANDRVQFGRPIGKFQAVQHQIAVLSEQAAAATAAADAAFSASDAGLSTFRIAAAKAVTSEAAGIGAGIAQAVHGAIGFTYEHALQFTTRRLWSWRSEFGSQSLWTERLGREACAAGGKGLWPAITAGGYGVEDPAQHQGDPS